MILILRKFRRRGGGQWRHLGALKKTPCAKGAIYLKLERVVVLSDGGGSQMVLHDVRGDRAAQMVGISAAPLTCSPHLR